MPKDGRAAYTRNHEQMLTAIKEIPMSTQPPKSTKRPDQARQRSGVNATLLALAITMTVATVIAFVLALIFQMQAL